MSELACCQLVFAAGRYLKPGLITAMGIVIILLGLASPSLRMLSMGSIHMDTLTSQLV